MLPWCQIVGGWGAAREQHEYHLPPQQEDIYGGRISPGMIQPTPAPEDKATNWKTAFQPTTWPPAGCASSDMGAEGSQCCMASLCQGH